MAIQDIWASAQKILIESRKIINKGLKPFNLTSAEAKILLRISYAKNEAISQETLVEDLGVTKAAISRAVNALVNKKYVLKNRSKIDRREYGLTLTNEAKKMIPMIIKIYDSVYLKALGGVNDEEIAFLKILFSKVSNNIGIAND